MFRVHADGGAVALVELRNPMPTGGTTDRIAWHEDVPYVGVRGTPRRQLCRSVPAVLGDVLEALAQIGVGHDTSPGRA